MGFGIEDTLNLPQGERQQQGEKSGGGSLIGGIVGSLTGANAGDVLMGIDSEATKTVESFVDNTDGIGIKAAPSRFNPFNVFRFRKFGLGENYDPLKHKDSNLYGSSNIGGISEEENRSRANLFQYIKDAAAPALGKKYDVNEYQRKVRNPTAAQIIETFKENRDGSASDVIGPTPYAYNDFIYCRDYGKIPNNRLVTLRRYPHPVDDSLRMVDENGGYMTPVPISQALTWYGEGTGNELSEMLPISWDMKWTELESKVQDITGNEVLVDDIIAALGITGEAAQAAIRGAVASGKDNPQQAALEIAGYDEKLQKYIRDAYGPDGPYWNRVLGPVNVINWTRKRDRGMGTTMFTGSMTINFTYSLRSYEFYNPRIAFLDLLSNFLTLTYNTAPFWGGGYRYFKKPGVAVANPGGKLIEQGRIIEGLQVTLAQWASSSSGAAKTILDDIWNQFKGKTTAGVDQNISGLTNGEVELKDASGKVSGDTASNILNILAAGRASVLMQAPLSYRSLLEGRPIGEWHMVIGNPMDPMAVVGNMVCTACEMKFSKELGADDFPKEVTFKVTLKHGKPRAKQDIESIFNLGGGPLSFSRLKPTSTESNTFDGGKNNWADYTQKANDPNFDLVEKTNLEDQADLNDPNSVAEQGASVYKKRVSEHYGDYYGNSSVLSDYLKKTKS